MPELSAVTFLFTDIEGSTRLWEQEPERMTPAMAHHDAISRAAVERNHGTIVKMTGDGVHAAFDRSLDALIATIEIQKLLSAPEAAEGLALPLRCGLHAGIDERRDGDFYGRVVNRAARIMDAAHGGQMLLSKTVADQISGVLPEGVSLRDLGNVRLRDLSSPEHIYQIEHLQLRREFPALRSLDSTPNNLTEQLSLFIGRERELAEIKQKLASSRLVTLLGMGGIGKSRLSMQLAADVLDDFLDGVWFVELAALTDSSSVPQAVASVLGIKEEAGKPVMDALIKHVRERRLLIVLDNCEHVIEACADLSKRLLQASVGLKMLVTSRDYLQIGGEMTYQVPPLSVPEPKQGVNFEQLAQHEAVRLFLDRAAASLHGFGLSAHNAAAIADICYCLDGIPLAIELAAARVRAVSVQNIAARLSDRFRMLATSDRTVLPRQRTLRALIDWSYDLLSEAERSLFQRLSVFAGGWTLEAAEAVCADDDLPRDDILDLLTHLVEKSLVAMDVGGTRYRMLDTVRHYSLEKLSETGKATAMYGAHLEFYLAIAEESRPHLAGPQQAVWLSRLDAERDNILAAHARNDDEQAARMLRLVFAMRPYWIHRGLVRLGYRVTLDSLARSGAQQRDLFRCQALHVAGQLCCYMGRYPEALIHLSESLAIAHEIGDRARIAAVQQPLGTTYLGLGNPTRARLHLEEAVNMAREIGNKRQLVAAINELAQLHRAEGRPSAAESLYTDVLALAHALGDQQSVAIALLNLAMVSIGRKSANDACRMLLDVVAIAEKTGSKPVWQSMLDACAGLAALDRQWEIAARFFGAAESQMQQANLRRDPADEAFVAPLIAAVREALSVEAFASAEAAGKALSHDAAAAELRGWLITCNSATSTHSL